MQELTHLRTRTAKHFETGTPGAYEARITSGPQHFRNTLGEWEDMANLLQDVPGGFAATTQDVRFGLEGGYLTFTYKGKSLQMRPTAIGMVDRTAPATRWRKLGDADYSNVTRSGNTATVHDIFPNTDLTVRFTDETVSKQFVIRQRPNYPDPVALGWNPATTFLVIVWDVQKPAGAVLRDTVTQEVVSSGYGSNNDLVVEDAQGNPVLYFAKGEGWSARENAKHYPVNYVSLGAQVPFGEAFRYDKAAIATYPLTLDPTTSVYGTASLDDYSVIRIDEAYTGSNFLYSNVTVSAASESVAVTNYDDGKGSYGAYVYRPVMRFSLAGISGTCTDATLYLYSTNASTDTILAYKLDANWGLQSTSVWGASASQIGSKTGWTSSAWNTISLSTSAVEASFGSTIPMRMQFQDDTTYSNPVTYRSIGWRSYDYGSLRPYLSITYTTGGSTTYTGSFSASSYIKQIATGSISAGAYIKAVPTGSFTADAHIAAAVLSWASPPDASSTNDTTPTLEFTSVASGSDVHFNINLDLSNAFNTGSLLSVHSAFDQTGWEYWDDAAWQPMPSTGMPAAKTGNNVRYTPPAPLGTGVWYRRVRQG